jgi:hypothetical protein
MATNSNNAIGTGVEPHTPPLFCPRCRRDEAATATRVCAQCGDRLVQRGYCPVCEDFLRLPVGALCPKHDLQLEADGPERVAAGRFGKVDDWVTVGRFTDSLAAEAPRIRLEAEGIPTFVDGERMGSRSMYHVATGGVSLKVPGSLAADARIILSQTWSSTAAELNIEEDDDELDEHWPQPDIPETTARNWLQREILLFLLFAPTIGFFCYLLLEWYFRR